MSETMIVCTIVAIVILILVIASKTMDILVGLLGTIAGIGAYIWLGSTDSYLTQLKWAFEFGVAPSELKTYCLVLVGISIVILVIGLLRGRKTQQVVVVEKQVQVPFQPVVQQTPTPAEPVKPVEEVKPVEPVKPVKPVAEPEPVATEEVTEEAKPEEKAEEVAEVKEEDKKEE